MKITSKPIPGLPRLSQADQNQLAESIQQHGVLVPLLVTHTGVLIDGEERWRIIQEQKIKNYPIRVFGRMNESERVEMAIRVNSERRQLTRAERQRLLLAYIQNSPQKSTREIADACKVGHATAARAKQKAGVSNETVGRDGRRYKPRPAASGAETLAGARLVGKLLEELPDGEIEGGATSRRIKKVVFDSTRTTFSDNGTPTTSQDYRLILGDFSAKSRSVASNSIDLGLSDPPWGWNADQLAPFMETYERILKPGALLATYSGVGQLAEMCRAAETAGLEYWWQTVCINPSAQMATRKDGMVRNLYRSIVIFRKPGGTTRKAKHWMTDIVEVEYEEKRYHPWEQPKAESVALLRGLSRPGWLVADLTAGSGTSAVAAIESGCRWIGFEIDPTNHKIASRRVSDALKANGNASTPIPIRSKAGV